MRLTLDGSNDEKNAFQGLSDFSFREEDAGVFDPAAISDVEEEEESDLDDSDIEVTENLPDYAVDPEEGAAAVLTAQQHMERFSATDPTPGFSIVPVAPAVSNNLIAGRFCSSSTCRTAALGSKAPSRCSTGARPTATSLLALSTTTLSTRMVFVSSSSSPRMTALATAATTSGCCWRRIEACVRCEILFLSGLSPLMVMAQWVLGFCFSCFVLILELQ